jgi:hypothetical protein
MNAAHLHPAPGPSRLDKEEPEIAQEDDIPADDKKADGDKWARGEGADERDAG